MIQRIREYIPNEPIQFKKNRENGEMEIHFINQKRKMSIRTFEDIKQYTDMKLDECSICHEKEPCNIRRVVCKKCTTELCINCHVQVGAQCPFCLFTNGEKFSVHMIDDDIRGIL
jgi:hypothetical protein